MKPTYALLSALLLTPPAVLPASAAAKEKPNVVVILADDLGWGDLSCYPKDPANPDAAAFSPHLDAMASQGVRFTQAYAQTMCSPSRAALLTGRFPQRFGFDDLSAARKGIPKTEVTLAEFLREHGYATACIGKWHVGLEQGSRPLDRGFERFYGTLGPAHDYFDPAVGTDEHGEMEKGSYVYDQDKPVTRMRYITDQLADVAIDFIRASAGAEKPFFLYLPFTAPHGPSQPRPDIHEEFKRMPARNPPRNGIRAVEDSIDANVGRVLRELFLSGLEGNTIVVFSSDNGGNEYETRDGEIRSHEHNGGLRGCKFTTWEGGFRVPLIIRWPGRFPANATYTQPVSLVDLYATVVAAAGLALPESRPLDSVDLLPFVTGRQTGRPHEVLFACNATHGKQWSIRKGDWKLVSDYAYTDPQDRASAPLLLGLYDLSADVPRERENLIEKHPEIAAELRRLRDAFVASCAPSIGRKPSAVKLPGAHP